VAERVQAYTHPLWMLLMAAAYTVTREAYLTSLVVSMVISLVAFQVCCRAAHSSAGVAWTGLTLLMSKAFIDYSTSGLENPLAHLLLGLFLTILLADDRPRQDLLVLSFVAALLAVNRMDALLLVIPALVLEAFRAGFRPGPLRALALGALPLAAWEAFSLFYYGFPFPNTAYAKLYTGIPQADLARQGLYYLRHSLGMDPLTLSAIGGAVVMSLLARNPRAIAVALGLVLHLAYVVRIGGDFMGGRLLAAPLVVAAVLLGRLGPGWLSPRLMLAPPAVVVVLGLAAPHPTLMSGAGRDEPQGFDHGIADERAEYYRYTGLLVMSRDRPLPNHFWAEEGLALRRGEKSLFVSQSSVGILGFFAGPHVHVVDRMALGDPLLARLPVASTRTWRIGHFKRDLPEGYLKTLRKGENHIADPQLALYYDRLTLLTRGPLLDRERGAEIVRMNLAGPRYPLPAPPPGRSPSRRARGNLAP
jgi:arabinofuranosyltransferase